MTGFGAAEFRDSFGVSRETIERLQAYVALIEKWNTRINLVSRGDRVRIWHRHIADSAQLWRLRPGVVAHWLDLGSGAGFPAIVLATLAKEHQDPVRFTLVESDARKSAFLRTALQALELDATLHVGRAESLPGQRADVVSARALAPVSRLLDFAEKHRQPAGICLFPKGVSVHKELADAAARWHVEPQLHPSLTDPRGVILEIGAFRRV